MILQVGLRALRALGCLRFGFRIWELGCLADNNLVLSPGLLRSAQEIGLRSAGVGDSLHSKRVPIIETL